MTTKKEIAQKLLQIKAVKLQPNEPFTWASGWKSPIYCDNRKTLSYPKIRKAVRDAFVSQINKKYPDVELIAGVATGSIAIGALVAEAMNLPFVYVRSSTKGHGLQNKIEGVFVENQKVVVIEDLISTGGSSLKAVKALNKANCKVLGLMAIFTYGFDAAVQNFKENNCSLNTLSDYNILIETALENNYIKPEELDILKQWRKNPAHWKQ